MVVSVKAVLRTDKVRANGTAPIYIRISANRKSRYLSTGIRVRPEAWSEQRQRIRSSHELAGPMNQKLGELLVEAKTEALQAKTAAAVKAAVVGSSGDLARYMERHIDDLKAGGQYWNYRKFEVTLRKLHRCFGEEVTWREFDHRALQQFENYLRTECKNGTNTVRNEMKRLGQLYKKAMKEGVIRPDENPFLLYDRPKSEKPVRRTLDIEEIKRLAALEAGSEGAPLSEALRLARDVYVFSFYAGGMRFSDMAKLRVQEIRGSRLRYVMLKTGTQITLTLPKPALTIIETHAEGREGDFVFPLLEEGDDADGILLRKRINRANARINKSLKGLAPMIGVPAQGFSIHTARHSFANYARAKSKDVYAVSKALGHTSLAVTQQYLRSFDQDAVDDLTDMLWD